jgi:predicted metal-dependent hydrolase
MSKIAYEIERSFSRKHTYITIRKDGTILIKANRFISKKAIDDFVESKRSWIEQKSAKVKAAQQITATHYFFLGELYPKESRSDEEINALYKEKVEEIIPPLVAQYTERMQLYPTRISYRNNKTRWGSCSAKDALSFNIQLAKTPLAFIEYVVVHELAHIRHKNHSKAFWQLVSTHLPDYRHRQQLGKEQHYIL